MMDGTVRAPYPTRRHLFVGQGPPTLPQGNEAKKKENDSNSAVLFISEKAGAVFDHLPREKEKKNQ